VALRRFYQADRHTAKKAAKCPEPLCPTSVLPPLGRCECHLLRGRYPSVIAPTGSCATPVGLSPASAFSLVRRVLAGCTQSLLPPGSFPTLSLKVFPWMLDPIPRRYTVCSHLFLPRCHRPSPNRDGSAARVCPTNNDFSWRRFSRLQIFLYVPASKFARPPDRSYRCEYCRRAAGAFTSGPIVLRYLHTHRVC
jgi:hypothetical protein